jgi:uncharacterized protein (DUF2141 family)
MLFLFLALPAQADPGVTLTVQVHGAASDAGTVMCQLFRSADGFPTDDPKASAYSASALRDGTGTCTFTGQAPGKVAIAAFHDENGDTKLQTNLLGMPAEGYGFSNGAKTGYFGPPSWEEAAVTVGAAPLTLRLELTK